MIRGLSLLRDPMRGFGKRQGKKNKETNPSVSHFLRKACLPDFFKP